MTGPAPVIAYLSLGSNVGDRRAHLAAALSELGRLPHTQILRTSGAIETAPVAPGVADPGGPYLNAAAAIQTGLQPRRLLDALLEIERRRGRDRSREARWGPRTLDLDLLLYGSETVSAPGLIIPHPRMLERRFVLEPLAEIAPEAIVPGAGLTVGQALARLSPGAPHAGTVVPSPLGAPGARS